MYGDFSRMTFSPAKHYTAVWSQQGRVQLDADANEQTAILLDWLRTLATDFIGPFGGHVRRAGFHVKVDGDELTLGPGHYYVHGLRCEVARPTEPEAPAYRIPKEDLAEPPYLVELLVWERSVSAVSDPDLLEPALGPNGPDTTVRTQVAWAPIITRALPGEERNDASLDEVDPELLEAENLNEVFEDYNTGGHRRPLLAARAERAVETAEQTIVPASAGYLGVENQLYRVEVHEGGRGRTAGKGEGSGRGATFKWSRDNGSAEFAIVTTEVGKTLQVTVASLGRDGRSGLSVGDWVELVDDRSAPFGKTLPLRVVTGIAGQVVTLDGEVHIDPRRHPYLRRWDQRPGGSEAGRGIPIVEPGDEGDHTWHELEDGVEVCFPARGANYRRGDYWLIPARTATGGVLWPGGTEPRALPPMGPERFLAPLAVVREDGKVEDVRVLFTHLAWPESERPE